MPAVSGLTIRPITTAEVDPILTMLEAWEPPGLFDGYFYGDPAFVPEHVCAAFDGTRAVSCAQIVPKIIRVMGGTATVAGIGQVWTEPEYRRRGIAPDVLRCCLDVMRRERFALSLLFASRFEFYGSLGWLQYARARCSVVGCPDDPPAARIREFDAAHDLLAVSALYDAYCADLPGTTVRDTTYWEGSLRYAAFPSETFLVATDNADIPIAYARGAEDHGTYVVMEYAYAADAHDVFAALLAAHGAHAQEHGGFFVMDAPRDPALRARLDAGGFQLNDIEDPFSMWQVIDASALPGAPPQPGAPEAERALLEQLLPPARYTFWHADHF